MRDFTDKVAVITGAGSGIGRELALCLAQEGCALAINDIHHDRLEATAELVRAASPLVKTYVFDVSKRGEVDRSAQDVLSDYGHVDILVNNAGVVVTQTVEDMTYEDFEWVMNINFWGVVHCTKTFLPSLKERPEALIINISSIDGILATPNNAPYCAAKSAVKALTDTLSQELQGSNVRVSSVIPGGVKTNIFRDAKFYKQACEGMDREECVAWFEEAASITPDKAARTIVSGMKKGKKRVLLGADARFLDYLARLMPVGATVCVGHFMRNLSRFKPTLMPKTSPKRTAEPGD